MDTNLFSSTFSDVPNVIIDEIISRVEVSSIPQLKASCKFVSNQITAECYNTMVTQHIKKQLESVIKIVRSYHVALTKTEVEGKLLKMLLVELYKAQGSEYYHMTITMMLYTVHKETNFGIRRVKETWARYVKGLPMIDRDDVILNSLKKFVVGTDKSVYIVTYNYIDKHSKTKSHYCCINLQFHNDGNVKMAFSIEDVDRYAPRVYRKGSGKPLQRSVRSIEILVNDTTLTELAECLVNVLGRKTCLSEVNVVSNIEKWVGLITKYTTKMFDRAIHSHVDPKLYRDEVLKILT